jgi:hypothetical protein
VSHSALRVLSALLTVFAPAFAGGQTASVPVRRAQDLIGTWEMSEEQELNAQDSVIARERNVSGLLVYTSEGRVAVQIMYRRGRPIVSTKNDEPVAGIGMGRVRWGADAARAVIDTYDAYFGTYVVDDQRHVVIHHAIGAMRPPGVGARFERQFAVHGDELWLRATDPAQRWRIIWRRVRS